MSFLLTTKKIINDWTDYNNHMNLSYYILLFDMGAEQMLSKKYNIIKVKVDEIAKVDAGLSCMSLRW